MARTATWKLNTRMSRPDESEENIIQPAARSMAFLQCFLQYLHGTPMSTRVSLGKNAPLSASFQALPLPRILGIQRATLICFISRSPSARLGVVLGPNVSVNAPLALHSSPESVPPPSNFDEAMSGYGRFVRGCDQVLPVRNLLFLPQCPSYRSTTTKAIR